ncbi:hypothetical protein ACPF8X_01615 [Streptomyces sp. G35A]
MSAAAHTHSQKLRIGATFAENMPLAATFAGGGLDVEPLALSMSFSLLLALKEVFQPRWLRLPTMPRPEPRQPPLIFSADFCSTDPLPSVGLVPAPHPRPGDC